MMAKENNADYSNPKLYTRVLRILRFVYKVVCEKWATS